MKRKYILMGFAMLSSVVAGAQDITDSIARKTQAVSTNIGRRNIKECHSQCIQYIIWFATGTVSHAADGVDGRRRHSFAGIQ